VLLRAHPKQILSRSPYSLQIAHARKGWLFPQGFCSLFVLIMTVRPVKECQQRHDRACISRYGDQMAACQTNKYRLMLLP
ncbi:hypothetical protein, partial [Mesorhizobium sp.]|uniref:hypothetical protein n=1 Tax=Mesorhizobium sp. TaxID=1871066 RepID=UPI0025E3E130